MYLERPEVVLRIEETMPLAEVEVPQKFFFRRITEELNAHNGVDEVRDLGAIATR